MFDIMFTGIIEELGKIKRVEPIQGGKRLFISCNTILEDLKSNDSVSVNGVCLTAVNIEPNGFWSEAVGETLKKTTLADVKINEQVNLERAMKLNDRLGGHIVQGHVNGIGTINQITKQGENYFIEVNIPTELSKYTISEGSISVDGISLTIAKLIENKVGISIIPHTWRNTILQNKKIGDKVNIETDFIAKYIEKLLLTKENKVEEKFTDDWFRKMGYE